MRKVFGIVSLLVILALALSACRPAAPPAPECKWELGLVTDVGEIDDKSFNEAAWNGVKEGAQELGLGEECYGYIETQDAKDYIPNIESFVEEGAKIIVTSGFAMGEATNEMAKKYPDVYFTGSDQWYAEPQDNLAGLVFNEDHSGFMAGCLAGLMTETNIVGGVYGTDLVPPVVYFREGYENGAKHCNPDVETLGAYHPGGLATGFTDPEWGHETAASMIDQGADVIFGAGGKTGNGGVEEAAERGVWAIGVDVDQYYTLPEFVRPYLLSSAMKMITSGFVDIIKSVDAGTFEGGQIFGPADLAPYHDTADEIPQEVKDKVAEVIHGVQTFGISTGVEK
jgi:basic membrane protein A